MHIDSDKIDFSEDGEDLHTSVYKEILNGNGIGLCEAKKTIELLHQIRKSAN
jgi:UDP-N-acetyl-2-amino-2-deoxyglucuronate dehydrogenase